MFLKGSTVSLFLFVSFLMTVECILTDDFIVMIMGIIITRRDGRIPHGRSVGTDGGSAEDQPTGGFSL